MGTRLIVPKTRKHVLKKLLGALMKTAFRTRPDICWAVTRVSRAVRANDQAEDVGQRARVRIKYIL
eukprot:9444633-Prorocentrum_lima.AAC.1